jgi:hypothetical protein
MNAMPVRTKKIYFRLTENELQALEDVCDRYGIANISEAVRAALANWAGLEDQGYPGEERMRRLRTRLQLLRAEADLLARRFGECLRSAGEPIPITQGLPPAPAESAARRTCSPRAVEPERRTG